MKKDLIKNYISKLTMEDVINYLKKEAVPATKEEIETLYQTIKTKYDEILDSDFLKFIKNYQTKFNHKLYNKIIEKYEEYKKFLK